MSLDPNILAPRGVDDYVRNDRWVKDQLKLRRSSIGYLERATVPGAVVTIREILTNPTSVIRGITDSTVAAGPGDVTIILTRIPIEGTEPHVTWGPLHVPISDWSRSGQVITIPDPEGWVKSGDLFAVSYLANDSIPAPEPPPPTGGIIVPFQASGWKYLQVARTDATDYSASGFDDSGWASGTGAFGQFNDGWSGVSPEPPAPTTNWDITTRLWLRRTVAANTALDLFIDVRVEDEALVYLNGALVGTIPAGNQGATVRIVVPAASVLTSNVLAIRATDDTFALPTGDSYLDAEISQ